MVLFPLFIFSPPAVEAGSHISPPSCPPPSSCCLLSFLVSPMNPVNTEALFAAAAVILSPGKTEPSQASSLCSAPTRVSGLPLLLTGKDERAAKRQSHGDWCCLRFCILQIPTSSVVFLFCCSLCGTDATCEPRTSYWSSCNYQRKINLQPWEGWVSPAGTGLKKRLIIVCQKWVLSTHTAW